MKLPSILRPGAGLLRLAATLAFSATACSAEDIVWDFGTAAPGIAAPLSTPANLTVSDVTQGNNFTTVANPSAPAMLSTGSATSAAYPGASQSYNAQVACRVGAFDSAQSAYFEVTLTPAVTYRVTVTDISYGARRTNTGPQNYSIRTNADSFAAAIATNPQATASAWALMTNAGLNVSSATPLTLRIYGVDGSGSPTAGQANWRIDDLKLSVIVTLDGAVGPTIADVTPLSGTVGTPVTINGDNFGADPVVRFNGTLATVSSVHVEGISLTTTVPAGATSGPVTVTTSGGAATSPQPFDVIPLPALTVSVTPDTFPENAAIPAASGTVSLPSAPATNLLVTLTSSDPAAATVSPGIVIIPAGETSATFSVNAVANPASFANNTATITATADGHDQGTFSVTVTNVDAYPTTVVINKFLNVGDAGTGDTVELLVIGDGTPGSTVDMRRMLLKDHSSSMDSDGGGRYRFNDIAFFDAVKAGTLIVITDSASTADIDPADFVLRLGLLDTTYFTEEAPTSNSFNIANPEMIMIKVPGAAADGGTGAIHSLAGGIAGTQFNNAPPKKLLAPAASATGRGVIANNSTSSLDDYNGTDATGDVAAAAMIFGAPNSTGNNNYIRALRGITSVDGAGLASITNGDAASVFSGKNYFPRNAPAQTVAINLLSNVSSAATTTVKLTVPAAWGAPVEENVSVTGAGAGAPLASVTGQEITLTGLAVTDVNPAVIAIAGLTSPNPGNVTDDGRYAFNILTAGDGGAPAAIATQPAALVRIPVASLRDVDANGFPADFNKTVAIEIICTEEDFDNTAHTSAFGQDGDSGINVFIRNVELNLVRNSRYAIIGQIIQFNGLTEISPASAADVIPLENGLEIAPLTITVPDLLLNPESYEGRLIKVVALNYVSGDWISAGTVAAADAAANPLDIRIQGGSAALTPPNWPATITGIFGQFDQTTPYTSGWQIMPRTDADVQSLGTGDGYGTWAAAYPGIGGPEDDGDLDGVSNLLEYAGGSLPDNAGSLPQELQTVIGNTLTVTWAKGAQAASDPSLTWTIEATTDLTNGPWTTTDVLNVQDIATSISGDYVMQPGQPKAWLRLKVERAQAAAQ